MGSVVAAYTGAGSSFVYFGGWVQGRDREDAVIVVVVVDDGFSVKKFSLITDRDLIKCCLGRRALQIVRVSWKM